MTKATENQKSLSCPFEQAEENHLLDGIKLSAAQKIEWFEQVTWLAWQAEQHNKAYLVGSE